jgi:hypothetical protein
LIEDFGSGFYNENIGKEIIGYPAVGLLNHKRGMRKEKQPYV